MRPGRAIRPNLRANRQASQAALRCLLRRPELAAIAFDERFRIGPDVAEPDFLLNLLPGDSAAVQRVGQKRVEIGFLPLVGMPRVVRRELAHDRQREVEQPPLLKREVDRQAGLPRLGAALGVVEQLGLGCQAIEVVPLGLEQADRVRFRA